MDADQQRQNRLDNAIEPKGILCPQCDSPMRSTTKDLEDYLDKPMRVLFSFECPKCKKRRGVYDDGSEFSSKPPLCSKCQHEAKITYKRKGNAVIWTTSCSSCGYKELNKDNPDKWKADRKKKEKRDKLLLKKYRADSCLSDKDGQDCLWRLDQMKRLVDEMEEREKHKKEYDAIANIKKLTIIELEKLLNNAVNPQGYIRLELSKPEFRKQLIVDFAAQDGNTSRQEYDSRNGFRKLVQEALADTNWRLMVASLSYPVRLSSRSPQSLRN